MKLTSANSQKIRFGAIGLLNTALDFGLLFLFTSFGLASTTANTISTGIALVFSFFANKNYTFKEKKGNQWRQIVLFFIVTLFGLWVIQNITIDILKPWLMSMGVGEGLSLFVAKSVATAFSMVWNYILYDRVVFRKNSGNHIVIDARTIESSTGRYMQRLVENINDHHQKDYRYTVIVPSTVVQKWQERLSHFTVVAGDQKAYGFAEQLTLPLLLWRLKPTLTHFTMPQQPLIWFGPSITTIHDTTLIRYDNIDSNPLVYKVQKAIFIGLMHVVMRRSKHIITPTEFVKNDLGSYFGTKFFSRITVTLEAGEIPDAAPEPIKTLTGKDFVFFVGNAFPYKNVKRLILAHEQLLKKYPKLVLALAGKKDFFYTELEEYCKKHNINQVQFLGFISDGEKRWALQHAKAFATASLSEGFCIPLLEAMTEGAPVVASNASCLPEVTGKAALLFDPSSTDDVVEKLDSLLSSKQLRQKMSDKGKARVKQFSWQKMASQTVAVYKKVVN
jgi:glycosyltransferase involved in cell wall biosynthesis